jgi:hypothetical protein
MGQRDGDAQKIKMKETVTKFPGFSLKNVIVASLFLKSSILGIDDSVIGSA